MEDLDSCTRTQASEPDNGGPLQQAKEAPQRGPLARHEARKPDGNKVAGAEMRLDAPARMPACRGLGGGLLLLPYRREEPRPAAKATKLPG